MQYQIINMNTNQKINIDFQPTKGNLIAYNYYPDYIEVPVELYDKDVVVIDGQVVEKPIDLEKLKTEKNIEVQSKFADVFLNGLDSATLGYKLHIKQEDQMNYMGAMIATSNLNDEDILPMPLIDFNGNIRQITKSQANAIYIEIVTYKAIVETKRATVLGQIVAATTKEEIEAIAIEF